MSPGQFIDILSKSSLWPGFQKSRSACLPRPWSCLFGFRCQASCVWKAGQVGLTTSKCERNEEKTAHYLQGTYYIVVLGCLCKKINCTQKLRNQLSANPYILKCGPTSVSAPYKENKSKLSWNWYSMTLKIRQTVFQQQEKNRLPYWCFKRAMLFWGLGPGWVEGTGCVHQPTCKSENTC